MKRGTWQRAAGFVALLLLGICAGALVPLPGQAQSFEYRWMAAGSLHNWYANTGGEIEEGRISPGQQDGLRWPAYFQYQDIQAAKALWIGATNFTDPDGKFYSHKVVHVGPRVNGSNEFFPTKFELVSRFELPQVYVDGARTLGERDMEAARVDPTIPSDVMIDNVVNTPLGVTMHRKIYQWSQQYHDNYIVSDYTLTNTSSKTVTGLIIYFHYRWAICADSRFTIGNATGWGINTMCDVRGDGVKNDLDDAVNIPGVYSAPHMRIQYAWQGRYPPFTLYDNIGGPLWTPYYDKADTIGRLAAAQFAGVVTLHCDTSPADTTDDFNQPSTTSWEGSDEDLTSQNDQYNGPKMTKEYTTWMALGHNGPRHVDVVEPEGKFSEPTGDPSLGTPGGFSNANGYGPYDLAPGESIRLVWAEGASGLSRERCISIGRRYKTGGISAKAKNDSVLTGRDSLFQTFRRALANFKGGYAIPRGPLPPKSFTVTSGGDKIALTWEVFGSDPSAKEFRIYRAAGRYDGEYSLIHTATPDSRSFDDINPVRGVAYYYYIQTVADASANTGAGLTPQGELLSNRIWTQTYDPAFLKRAAGNAAGADNMDSIRVVPNPFSIRANATDLRFKDEPDKIAFFNIPGFCTIRIYTEIGELVKEIQHTDGSGDAYWYSVTSSGQIVVSGIYIVVIDNTRTGERVIKKLSIIR